MEQYMDGDIFKVLSVNSQEAKCVGLAWVSKLKMTQMQLEYD